MEFKVLSIIVVSVMLASCRPTTETEPPPTASPVPPTATFTEPPPPTPTNTETPEPTETQLPSASARVCIIFNGEPVDGLVWYSQNGEQLIEDLPTSRGCRNIDGIPPGDYEVSAGVYEIEECVAPYPCKASVEYHFEPGSENEIVVEVFEIN